MAGREGGGEPGPSTTLSERLTVPCTAPEASTVIPWMPAGTPAVAVTRSSTVVGSPSRTACVPCGHSRRRPGSEAEALSDTVPLNPAANRRTGTSTLPPRGIGSLGASTVRVSPDTVRSPVSAAVVWTQSDAITRNRYDIPAGQVEVSMTAEASAASTGPKDQVAPPSELHRRVYVRASPSVSEAPQETVTGPDGRTAAPVGAVSVTVGGFAETALEARRSPELRFRISTAVVPSVHGTRRVTGMTSASRVPTSSTCIVKSAENGYVASVLPPAPRRRIAWSPGSVPLRSVSPAGKRNRGARYAESLRARRRRTPRISGSRWAAKRSRRAR